MHQTFQPHTCNLSLAYLLGHICLVTPTKQAETTMEDRAAAGRPSHAPSHGTTLAGRAWISRLTRSISFLMLCRRCISSFSRCHCSVSPACSSLSRSSVSSSAFSRALAALSCACSPAPGPSQATWHQSFCLPGVGRVRLAAKHPTLWEL